MRFFAGCRCALWSASSYSSSFEFNIIRFLWVDGFSLLFAQRKSNRFMRLVSSILVFHLPSNSSRTAHHNFHNTHWKRELFVQLLTLKYGFIALEQSLTCHLCSQNLKGHWKWQVTFWCFFSILYWPEHNIFDTKTRVRPVYDLFFICSFSIFGTNEKAPDTLNAWIFIIIVA